MLRELLVKNYALIDSLQLNLKDGFSTITGETGAGKSILLGALGMIQGKRADLGTVINKDKKCIVEAVFEWENDSLHSFFKKENLDFDDEIILRREISINRKSRAFVNDTPVTLAVLQQLSSHLMDIHSQNDTGEIIQKSFQLNLLDALAGQTPLRNDYKRNFQLYNQIKHERLMLEKQWQEQQNNQSYHHYLLEELETAQLKEDEQKTLEEELKWLSNTEEIKTNLSKVIQMNVDEQIGLQNRLHEVNNCLNRIINAHPAIEKLAKRAKSLEIEVDDLLSEVETLFETVEDNPARMEQINTRLQLIYSLQKKHQVNSIEALLNLKNELKTTTDDYAGIEQKIKDKKQEEKDVYKQLSHQAEQLHRNRVMQSSTLCDIVKQTLHQLEMKEAELSVDFSTSDELTPTGKDDIEMLFSTHKKSKFQSIKKVASGGERSRLMLAIKKILAEKQQLPTLILDEIDTGISGKAAEKMGILMQEMAKNMQIISVTHLPQIAAKGNQHLSVFKIKDDSETYTRVKELSYTDRVKEIAQMISGNIISKAAEKQAKELLK